MHLPENLLNSLKGIKGFDREVFEKVHISGEQITSIRINPTKFKEPLTHHSPFITHDKIPWSQYGYYLDQRPSFTFDPLFHAGCYYVQEASSMFLEQALQQTVDLSQPLKVLDLCGAPGGKSTHIQSLISKESLLVTNEVIKNRVSVLVQNITKWGCDNVIVTHNDPKHFTRLEGYFDVIIIDAPCSGSGLFRKDAEAVAEWSLNNVALCSQRQQRILADALPSLKTNGILIYSTCSYSKAASNFTTEIAESFGQGEVISEAVFQLPIPGGTLITIFLGLIIGSISFAGSMIAWGKLNGKINDWSFKGQHIFNIILLISIIGLSILLLNKIENSFVINAGDVINTGERITFRPGFNIQFSASIYAIFYIILLLSVLYGILFVLPIGGADMPVVISLLNSFTGVAAALGGFLYDNKVMLTGGILVGAAGTLLTVLMCKAMNRSLKNVLIGSFGGNKTSISGDAKDQGHHKEINLNDAAVVMAYANKIMIVPGYGLAVAQAQHACHELEKILNEKGVQVQYAIHPVAGRMPGHMNVLLAEADVSYEKLLEMEEANEEFSSTDVVLILGANDVVNPAAKTDTNSPIYGMPILDVELAKTVIVNKRSMKPGYAGIENDLFFQPKTSMLFGDAKKVLQDLISEIKQL